MKHESYELMQEKIEFLNNDFKLIAKEQSLLRAEQAFHEEIEIKYFYDGASALMIDKDVFLAKAGDIAIVNPYEMHSRIDIEQYNGRYFLLIISMDFFANYNNDLDLRKILLTDRKKFHNMIRGDKRLQGILLRIMQETRDREPHYKQIVAGLLGEFFWVLLRSYLDQEKSLTVWHKASKNAELISPALSKIHKDYAKRLKVEELADVCHISKYYFCRVFKQVTNMTVVQYIIKYRLDIAEFILRDTNKNVSEIALSCGFEDESYFYRCYKKYKGVSPKRTLKEKN